MSERELFQLIRKVANPLERIARAVQRPESRRKVGESAKFIVGTIEMCKGIRQGTYFLEIVVTDDDLRDRVRNIRKHSDPIVSDVEFLQTLWQVQNT